MNGALFAAMYRYWTATRDPSAVIAAPLIAAAATAALGTAQIAIGSDEMHALVNSPARLAAALVVLLAMAAVSSQRITWPRAAFVGVLALMPVLLILVGRADLVSNPLYWFAIVTLSIRVEGSRLVAMLILGICWEVATVTIVGGIDGEHRGTLGIVTNAVVTYTVFGLIGRLVAHSRSQALSSSQALTRAERELTRAEQEYEQKLQRSIESERQLMARELHDVAAFHLTGMIVQAKAADTVFHSDPARAQSMLAEAITQGQRSLSSLRQIVGILRYAEGEERRPLPNVHDIAELVDQSRTSFASIEYDLRAADYEIDAIDTGAQLTCYRIVQESLANALRHAPGCDVRVSLRIDRNALRIVVHNSLDESDQRAHGCGFGIAGMKERATLLGGFATAGPDGNGWTVRAELPLTEGGEILPPNERTEETL
ncbi:hypothetical protein ERC79_20195 [Rhodococcus sp. ABRD24]|uniref:sensor histidine kinase n=1 Tax=Rhodococcus sp. ABRD24 TaxID=2507582 RepID=UPI001038FA54|nr:histidine kinase [Rhodococcus sp. ABRD24]QBJ97999.1 hypothetical protein ERC79_20195 [Rhodococcus sp. ABRD24]